MTRDKIIVLFLQITLLLSSSISTRYNISFYFWIVLYIFLVFVMFPYCNFKKTSQAITILVITFLWGIVKMFTTQDGIFVLGAIWLPTSVIVLYFSTKNRKKFIFEIKKFLILLFVINAVISIYETYTHNLLIYPERPGVINTDVGFRSAGLFGHPLQNAMTMSILTGFILVDSILSSLKKYTLFILGIISILSSNSRSSIILWGPFILMYIWGMFFNENLTLKNKLIVLLSSLSILLLACYMILYGGMGDRIFGDLFDPNTNTRIEIWSIFNKASFQEFCFGFSEFQLRTMMKSFTVDAIENSFIMFVLYEGYIYTFIILCLYIAIIKKLFKGYSIFSKIYTSLIFVAYSNVNNALSASFFPLLVFILAIISFHPQYQK